MRAAWIAAGAVGVAAVFLLDPRHGAGRRARLAGQIGRLLGTVAPPGLDAGPDDDLTVLSRAESVLHGTPGFPRYGIELEVTGGRLTLRGEVATPEQAGDIIKAASAVRGVTAVESLLRLPGEPPRRAARRGGR